MELLGAYDRKKDFGVVLFRKLDMSLGEFKECIQKHKPKLLGKYSQVLKQSNGLFKIINLYPSKEAFTWPAGAFGDQKPLISIPVKRKQRKLVQFSKALCDADPSLAFTIGLGRACCNFHEERHESIGDESFSKL